MLLVLTARGNLGIIPAALLPAIFCWVNIVLGSDTRNIPTSPCAGMLIAEKKMRVGGEVKIGENKDEVRNR